MLKGTYSNFEKLNGYIFICQKTVWLLNGGFIGWITRENLASNDSSWFYIGLTYIPATSDPRAAMEVPPRRSTKARWRRVTIVRLDALQVKFTF